MFSGSMIRVRVQVLEEDISKKYIHVLPVASISNCVIEMKDKIRYETSMGKMSTDRNF